MKYLILYLILCIPLGLSAQKVYITTTKAEAGLIVYKASTQAEADTVVRVTTVKTKSSLGYWYFTSIKSEADLFIYITNTKVEASKIIYFKDSQY